MNISSPIDQHGGTVRKLLFVTFATILLTSMLLVSSRAGALETTDNWSVATQTALVVAPNLQSNYTVQPPTGLNPASQSCTSTDNCALVGSFPNGVSNQGFVLSEVDGVWGTPVQLVAPDGSTSSVVIAVSCPTQGNCSASGVYFAAVGGASESFVVDEVNGSWGSMQELTGVTTLSGNGGGDAATVSCSTAGYCSVGGDYVDGNGDDQAYDAIEIDGVWGPSTPIPGVIALNVDGDAAVNSMNCVSQEDCIAQGDFSDGAGTEQYFQANMVNSVWQTAVQTSNLSAPAGGTSPSVNSYWCLDQNDCVVGGAYTDANGNMQAWIQEETGGRWTAAVDVPGLVAMNVNDHASVQTVACSSAGNCSVGGTYDDGNGVAQAFVDNEVNGSWLTAIEVPGTDSTGGLNTNGNGAGSGAVTQAIACSSDANCVAGGYYTGATGLEPFVDNEINGTWEDAEEVPGIEALNTEQFGYVSSVSCPTNAGCTADGYYNAATGNAVESFQTTQLSAISLSPSTDVAPVDSSVALSVVGADGTGSIDYSVSDNSSSSCAISGQDLTASSVGTCTVTAQQNSDGTYPTLRSHAVSVAFVAANTAPVVISQNGLSLSSSTTNGESTIDVAWFASSGASSYTCTLLYGFNNPAGFSVTSSTPQCSFAGLAPGTGYGVEVVASSGAQSLTSQTAFITTPTPSAKKTIYCHKAHVIIKRVGMNPSCPSGYSRGR